MNDRLFLLARKAVKNDDRIDRNTAPLSNRSIFRIKLRAITRFLQPLKKALIEAKIA